MKPWKIHEVTIEKLESLVLLNKIGARGPVPAMLKADTAIGRTLETLLGIDINSSKKPDYKGIELKSYRDIRGNRKNLFAQVPDWNLSKFKSSAEILNAFGYNRGDDFKLYCTVSSLVRNSQGLKLKMDSEKLILTDLGYEYHNPNSITAFHRHWRPGLINGQWDDECCNILSNLIYSICFNKNLK